MIALAKKFCVPAVAGLASLGFTPAPSIERGELWEGELWQAVAGSTLAQNPQNPAKKADDDSSFVGLDDLALASWPGLGTVSGLSTLPSPLGGNAPAAAPGGGTGGNRSPKIPQAPQLPQSRVVPTAPVEPLSQYMP